MYLSKIKRLVDIIASLFALVLLAPVFLAITLFSYREYKKWRNILFFQPRVGLHGQVFNMLKFRSMVVNASEIGEYYTTRNDPRVTKLGSFLRKYSLDELPQLINVLKGDMSLIGPRPNVLIQQQFYTEQEWVLRCSVRPGITGLAQADMRSQATTEQRKNQDLYYIKNINLKLDIKIILMTLKQIIKMGSY